MNNKKKYSQTRHQDFHTSTEDYYIAQKKRFYQYLRFHVATVAMVSNTIDIPEKNLCRYKSSLERAGKIRKVYHAPCHFTGNPAWYLTAVSSHLNDRITD